jgi:hypothetical protein
MNANLCIFEGRLFGDSRVLQTASQHGWAVKHAGFGDFHIEKDGKYVLSFVRIDGTTTDTVLREQVGWRPHGRIHQVQLTVAPLDVNPGNITEVRALLPEWEEWGDTETERAS